MKVIFKEEYKAKPVTRTCTNMSKEEIIKIYDLDNPDIEWYKFVEDE